MVDKSTYRHEWVKELGKKGITKSDPRIVQILREMEKKNPSNHLEAQFTYHEFSKYGYFGTMYRLLNRSFFKDNPKE